MLVCLRVKRIDEGSSFPSSCDGSCPGHAPTKGIGRPRETTTRHGAKPHVVGMIFDIGLLVPCFLHQTTLQTSSITEQTEPAVTLHHRAWRPVFGGTRSSVRLRPVGLLRTFCRRWLLLHPTALRRKANESDWRTNKPVGRRVGRNVFWDGFSRSRWSTPAQPLL